MLILFRKLLGNKLKTEALFGFSLPQPRLLTASIHNEVCQIYISAKLFHSSRIALPSALRLQVTFHAIRYYYKVTRSKSRKTILWNITSKRYVLLREKGIAWIVVRCKTHKLIHCVSVMSIVWSWAAFLALSLTELDSRDEPVNLHRFVRENKKKKRKVVMAHGVHV